MTWGDRLKEAAYTPNTGGRIVFLYEDVSDTFEKRTSGFNFPDVDGTYVQDLGNTGRKYPLTVIFTGPNNDLDGDAFLEALRVKGPGSLDHPVYGTVSVIPFGEIKRTNAVKTAANETKIFGYILGDDGGIISGVSKLTNRWDFCGHR